jgi:16S rRNA (guanine527-N7)-methyltransferase
MPQIAGLDVSRETIERLEVYSNLLIKWNASINLVSKLTIPDLWNRHIADSAQLLCWDVPIKADWIDIGSGGGLPGIVVAAILKETDPSAKVTMVESDQRKSAFLRVAATTLDLQVGIIAERAETLEPAHANVLSARALMSLDGLLSLGKRHILQDGCLLLLKGRSFQDEIEQARQNWHFDVVERPSITDNEAKMLQIRNIERANA